jgi:glycosyltransferase involved in cell wall biosynthesis
MNPLLSVCLITYNHKDYIVQAIEGVLMQKVNFSFELIIADDFSTDGTREIILDYEKKYPSLISLILQKKNVGPLKNWLELIKTPKAKYIAYFEGDDYWTDFNKLQKQVDFLETNRDFVLCYHNTNILINGNLEDDYLKMKNIPQNSSYYDLLCFGNFMQTSSVVFLNNIKSFPFEKGIQLNDYILWFWISQFGKIYRFNEIMSVYRFGSGIWSTLNEKKKIIHTLNGLFEVKHLVKNDTDIIILDNRINSLILSLLPNELKKQNTNGYDLKEFLSKHIKTKVLINILFYKNLKKIFYLK